MIVPVPGHCIRVSFPVSFFYSPKVLRKPLEIRYHAAMSQSRQISPEVNPIRFDFVVKSYQVKFIYYAKI